MTEDRPDPYIDKLLGYGVASPSTAHMLDHDQQALARRLSDQFGWRFPDTLAAIREAIDGEYDSIQKLLPGVNAHNVRQLARREARTDEPTRVHLVYATHRLMLQLGAPAGQYPPDLDDEVTSDALDEPQAHHPRGTYTYHMAEANKLLAIAAQVRPARSSARELHTEYLRVTEINAQLALAAALHDHADAMRDHAIGPVTENA